MVNNLRLPSSESIALYTFEREFIATLHYIFPSLPKNRKITEWSESEEEATGQEKLKNGRSNWTNTIFSKDDSYI